MLPVVECCECGEKTTINAAEPERKNCAVEGKETDSCLDEDEWDDIENVDVGNGNPTDGRPYYQNDDGFADEDEQLDIGSIRISNVETTGDDIWNSVGENDKSHSLDGSFPCSHCGNSNIDLFSLDMQCYRCMTDDFESSHVTSSMKTARNRANGDLDREYQTTSGRKAVWNRKRNDRSAYVIRKRIRELRELARGDHVACHKWYAIWHHAIVIEALPDTGQLTVIHNNGDVKLLDGKLASVRLETIDVDPEKDDLYRYDYSTSGLYYYPADEVVHRAASRLGETYNPFRFNCEHFARWCKTGSQCSGQVCELLSWIETLAIDRLYWTVQCKFEAAVDICTAIQIKRCF